MSVRKNVPLNPKGELVSHTFIVNEEYPCVGFGVEMLDVDIVAMTMFAATSDMKFQRQYEVHLNLNQLGDWIEAMSHVHRMMKLKKKAGKKGAR